MRNRPRETSSKAMSECRVRLFMLTALRRLILALFYDEKTEAERYGEVEPPPLSTALPGWGRGAGGFQRQPRNQSVRPKPPGTVSVFLSWLNIVVFKLSFYPQRKYSNLNPVEPQSGGSPSEVLPVPTAAP